MEREDVVVVDGISKKYGKMYAVKELSFRIRKNSIFGLLGSNGAGKSTTLHILMGLLEKDEGNLVIFGEQVKKKYSRGLKRKVAIVPQEISLYKDLSIYDNLYFFGVAYGFSRKTVKSKIDRLRKVFGLGDLKRTVKHLSGGYQRRVSFAVALIGDPDLIILDEALVGIDIETKKLIVDLLLDLKKTKTIIITTHSIHDAETLCDDVLLLHQGDRKVYGKTSELIEEYDKTHSRSLNVIFKEGVRAREFAKELKLGIPNKVVVDNSIVSVKFKERILFNLRSNECAAVLVLARPYKNDIVDIEIKRSGLDELMMDVIKT